MPAGWPATGGRCGRDLGYAGKNFGAQNFYTSAFPYQYEETQTIQGQAVYNKAWDNLAIEAALHHRTHVDEFQLYREHEDYYVRTDDGFLVFGVDTAASWYSAPNNHISHTTGGRYVARYASSLGETFVSADVRREFIKSNVLGVDSLGDDDVESVYQRGDVRLNTDVAVGHRAVSGSVCVVGDGGMEPELDVWVALCAGCGACVGHGRRRFVHFVCVGQPFRAPPVLHGPLLPRGRRQGSRDLQSEWADHLEAGVRLSLGNSGDYAVQFEQALYHRQGHDLIDWARPNGSDTTFAINLREVTFTGLKRL